MDWESILPGSRAPAKSDSTSRWRNCRSPVARRSTPQFRKGKITSYSSPFHRVRANDCRRIGTGNFPNYRSLESANCIKHPTSNIEHCSVATFISKTPTETEAIGRRFAKDVNVGSILALEGELGSGKTQFVKGLVAGLGSTAAITSPTFTIVHEYPGGRLPVYHFDFFRLQDRPSVARIGLDEYLFGDGVCVIEWADRFPDLIPANARWISFKLKSENERIIKAA